MPMWSLFAFDAESVAEAILRPAQEAVRNRDLLEWQKVFDQLNRTHYCPSVSGKWYSPLASTITGSVGRRDALTPDNIPEESSFGLRRTLQTFVEQASPHRVEGTFPRARHWMLHEIAWPKILTLESELNELELFNKEVLMRRENLPDPFWCLESNNAVDSSYVEPKTVARLAEAEATAGLFRRLVRRSDLDQEVKPLVRDLATAGLLIELAASRNLALYFREDGT